MTLETRANHDSEAVARSDGHYGTGVPIAKLDPAREVRDLKRWVQFGVYSVTVTIFAVMVVMSASGFHYGVLPWVLQVGLLATGLTVATAAIELTFNRMFRLRRRGVYPGITIAEIGSLQHSADACQAAVDLSTWLLDLRAALAVKYDGSDFSLAAFTGLDRHQAERVLRAAMVNIRQALHSGIPIPFDHRQSFLRDTVLEPGEVLMLVPVRSLDRPIGVLGLIGEHNNESLIDTVLLQGIGLGLGLSLENLRQKEELKEMAARDELTHLHNRRYFFEEIERQVAEARRYNSRLALLLLDLDGLKRINDSYGHLAGDEALRTVAQRLVRQCRAADIVARLGGDEFAVILPRSDHHGAEEMASRLCRAVSSQPLLLADGTFVALSVSCGLAAFPDDGDDVEAIVREADTTMYSSKAANRAQRR